MITMTDLFCGLGGSSTGAVGVPGVRVRMAANHWPLAIESHNANHPDTDHDCADLSQVDPRRYPRTDILWASPECTNHSIAKGVKRLRAQEALPGLEERLPDEAATRSRATMWDVPRFAEHHLYDVVIVENVADAAKWIMFPAWLQAMELLGYAHETVWLNSMHAQAAGLPAPQSRDRMYVVFWRVGNRRPDLDAWTRPLAVCAEHGEIRAVQAFKRAERWGKYRAQYVYRCPRCATVVEPGWLPASAAIDWSLTGQRIGDRARPLAEKTRERIARGIERYWGPLVVAAAGNTYDSASGKPGSYLRAWPTGDVLQSQTTTVQHGVAVPPLMVPVEGRDGKSAGSGWDALRTQSTRNETALVVPYYSKGNARPATEPLGTVTTVDSAALVVPLRNHGVAKPASQVVDTVAANGNHHALVDRVSLDVDDVEFRMLEPHEIVAAMAFPSDYVVMGTKRERVKQAGNAVTPPSARDLVSAVVESLVGGSRRAELGLAA